MKINNRVITVVLSACLLAGSNFAGSDSNLDQHKTKGDYLLINNENDTTFKYQFNILPSEWTFIAEGKKCGQYGVFCSEDQFCCRTASHGACCNAGQKCDDGTCKYKD